MANGEVYDKFVFTVMYYGFVVQFCIFVSLLKTATASLFTLGLIKNIMLICFKFCEIS